MITKQETHIIDGRRVIIIVNSNSKDLKRINLIKAEIMIISQTEDMPKRFPRLTYYLQDELPATRLLANHRPAGLVNADAEKGLFEIFLSINNLTKSDEIRKVLHHELMHIYQEAKNQLISTNRKQSMKLTAAIKKKLISSDLSEVRQHHAWIRTYLLEFFRALLIEGQARFSEYYFTDGTPFTPEYLQWTYNVAKKQAENLRLEWSAYSKEAYQDQWKRAKILQPRIAAVYENSYVIGFHVIYSLFYFDDNIGLTSTGKMGIFKLIKKYEDLIIKAGYTPVISATSGLGIIDYKRLIAEWWSTAEGKVIKNKF